MESVMRAPETKIDPKAQEKLRALARYGRQVLDYQLREKRMRARDRKYLQVIKQNWMTDALDLRSKLLEVNETFRVDVSDAEIDAAIERLVGG